jgi:hypothetical protein
MGRKWTDLEVALATFGVFVALGTIVMAVHRITGAS